jgi:hypothetical protein
MFDISRVALAQITLSDGLKAAPTLGLQAYTANDQHQRSVADID